jgi:hypothetical protein
MARLGQRSLATMARYLRDTALRESGAHIHS